MFACTSSPRLIAFCKTFNRLSKNCPLNWLTSPTIGLVLIAPCMSPLLSKAANEIGWSNWKAALPGPLPPILTPPSVKAFCTSALILP